ncbi:MAG: M48 family metalloprotease [Bacteroidota bacterium]
MKNLSSSRFSYLTLFCLTLMGITVLSCSKNPVTGKRELMLMSEKQEIALGSQSDPDIVNSFGLYSDSTLQRFITSRGERMARISHRPNLNYEFKVLDSPVINAFAVPGGYVYFTRGILAHFNNEAEFAGVLGHEIGHITARHSAKQYSKTMVAQVGLIVGIVTSDKIRQFADLAQTSISLLFLKFSRDNESESDRLGVEYSTRVGYDAHYMADFFKTLNRMRSNSGGEAIPDFMSTHPDPADRYRRVGQLADKWQRDLNKTKLKVNRDSYLRMIDGLVYGEDPRQGFFENNRFYHPEMKFQFPVPNNWKTSNSPAKVQMAPESGQALLQLSLAQGKSLDEAAQNFVQNNELSLINSSKIRVNGFQAIKLLADQINQQDANGSIRILTYIIQFDQLLLQLDGLALTNDFAQYERTFENSIRNFDRLSDPDKLNRQPDRIRIRKVNRDGSLAETLRDFKVSSQDMEEIAILNSMELKDQLKRGSLIKVVGQ